VFHDTKIAQFAWLRNEKNIEKCWMMISTDSAMGGDSTLLHSRIKTTKLSKFRPPNPTIS
jgi:hypothetical protein